jgi:hypothetical protein
MAYSFLSDAFPSWKEKAPSSTGLYEDFESKNVEKTLSTTQKKDLDLRVDYPLQTNRGSGPQPFDMATDYYKLITGNWEKDMAQHAANARAPFEMEHFSNNGASSGGGATALTSEYQEEEQLTRDTSDCMGAAKHIDQCSACKQRIEQVFRNMFTREINQAKAGEIPKKSFWGDAAELLLLVVVGLFVIFVLDGFVRLGRYLRV